MKNDELAKTFNQLRARWGAETSFSSPVQSRFSNSTYQEIINLGTAALPYILEALEESTDHWFYALSAITRYDAAEGETTIEGARQKWLAWGRLVFPENQKAL